MTPFAQFHGINRSKGTALAILMASGLLVLPAVAQDGAQPRDIPEGFVLPGPAPTNAPDINPDGTPAGSEAGESPSTGDETSRNAPASSEGGSMAPTTSTVVGEGRTAANPMAFAAAPETGTTNWPCVQRQVETIQPAQVWSGPDLALGDDVERTGEMRAVVDQAIARRNSADEAQDLVRDYLETVPADERGEVAAALFSDILSRLNAERGQVMSGIMRYGSRQKDLAEGLREKAARMAALQREGDASAFAEIREEIAWDTRVFDDRRHSLTFVCEVPILIERRAFALGRELSEDLG